MHYRGWAQMAICCYFWDFKEWVYYKREGKYSPLMHAFLPCLLFFLSTSLFIFFSVISLYFLPQLLSLSIYGYYSYLHWFKPMGFLYFTPMAHQPFLSAMKTSSGLPIILLVFRSPLHLVMLNAFSLFHYPFHNRS